MRWTRLSAGTSNSHACPCSATEATSSRVHRKHLRSIRQNLLLWGLLCALPGLLVRLPVQAAAVGLAGAGLALLSRRRYLAILPILFAAGVMAGQGRGTDFLSTAPPGEQRLLLNTPVLAHALVLARPQQRLRGWMAVLRLRAVERGNIHRPAGDRVRLYGSGTPPELREGDRLRAWLILSRPHN